jgi:hypothetical protein
MYQQRDVPTTIARPSSAAGELVTTLGCCLRQVTLCHCPQMSSVTLRVLSSVKHGHSSLSGRYTSSQCRPAAGR